MTAPREYWIGTVYVVEWDLADVDGTPVTAGTVAGTIRLPSGSTAAFTVDHVSGTNRWTLSHKATVAGRHGWSATASAGADGAIGGEFVVNRDRTGADPITVDPTTDVGLVRLLVTDLDEAFPLLTDEQISALLTAEGANVKRSAALGLELIARSEVLLSKKITTQDLSVDGPAVAKELRESAQALRQQAAMELDDYGLDIVPLWRFNCPPPWADSHL